MVAVVDTQMTVNALLLVPALLFGVVAVRAARAGRTRLGLGVRDGAAVDLGRGVLFGAVMVALLCAVLGAVGVLRIDAVAAPTPELVVILVYFLVLFAIEEVVFRALLMTGLGVLAGRWAALVITSVLVALPYAFATGSGIVPLIGAFATNIVNGLARWRTGRIWFGLGMRWAWNGLQVALGFTVSGYQLAAPVVRTEFTGPSWLTGGDYGPEGGVLGILVRLVMIVILVRMVRGRVPSWDVAPCRAGPECAGAQR